MAALLFIKSRKLFLKIQEGIGDNLSQEDVEAGGREWGCTCPRMMAGVNQPLIPSVPQLTACPVRSAKHGHTGTVL